MKKTTLILFLSLYFPLFGQTNLELHKRLMLLVDSTKFISDTTGISSFSVIPNPCEDIVRLDNYNVADLNCDGLKDLIFSGPCRPYNFTYIYINMGTELKLAFKQAGKVISIQYDSTSTTINILREACCCDKFSELLELKIDSKKKLTENSIHFHSDTRISIDKSLDRLVFSGIIRTTPIVDDLSRPDECSDEIIEGNKLMTIKKKAEVIHLAKNGNWRLILFLENDQQYWLGWIQINE